MTTAKSVILTAIHFKGVGGVEREAKQLAENLFCSEAYVKSIVAKVKKGEIIIK